MPAANPARDEAQIREQLEVWAKALHAKDLDALMALYAPDTVTFDLMPPQQVQGVERYRKNFERWLAAMPGPIRYRVQDLRITASADVAFCHGLSHIEAIRANGEQADYWVRVTVGFQKRHGQWLMIHDHVSVPFDMDTTQAVFDLRR